MKKLFIAATVLLLATPALSAVVQRSATSFPTATPASNDYWIFTDTSNSGLFSRVTTANVPAALGVPLLAAALAGDCTVGPCLDGTSDGGTLIKLYGPGGFWTAIQAGNALANVSWRFPLTLPPAGTTRLINADEYGNQGLVDPATFLTPSGVGSALTVTATGFDGNLATTDNTIQEIAQKFDDFVASGGGYTNLTSFIAQTPNAVFYSDANGDVKEVVLGANGTYFRSNGAGAAPTFDTPSGAAHDAVTLDTELATILSLSTQQITLDSQTANYFLAAPNGSAGDPTFRSMVDADIPAAIARDSELPTASSLSVDDLITLSGVATGAVNLGTFTGTTIADSSTVKTALQAVETEVESKADSTGISFLASALSDMKILDAAQPVTGQQLVLDTMAYANADDALHVWSIDKVGSELAGKQASDSDLTAVAALTTNAVGLSLLDDTSTSALRTTIGMTANGSSLVTAANYAAMRTMLDLESGVDFNAYDADLTTWAGVTPGTGVATFLATPSSANLATAITDETGSGAAVFGTSPVFTTSAALPQGASPTVDAAGEVAVDTTSDQFIYYGAAKRVVTYKKQIDFAVKTPVDADDFILFKAQTAMTITDIHVIAQGGTSISVDIQECTSAGASCATVDAAITADTDGAEDDGTLSNGAIDAGDWVKVVLGAPSGTVNYLAGSIYYVETAN